MSVHGHRTTFEKIPVTRRAAFNDFTLEIARECEDEFYNSWKSYRAEHPAKRSGGGDSEVERLINVLIGNDDEPGGVPDVPAAAALPAPGHGAAAVHE